MKTKITRSSEKIVSNCNLEINEKDEDSSTDITKRNQTVIYHLMYLTKKLQFRRTLKTLFEVNWYYIIV